MKRKGSALLFSLMLGLTIIVLALALAPAVKTQIDNVRNTTYSESIDGDSNPVQLTGLDCENPSISKYDKAACVTTDLTIFYFIAGLIFVAGSIITARIIMQ